MHRVLSGEQMRRCDANTIDGGTPSFSLMKRAALAVAKIAAEKFNPQKTLALCGGGNNGGDGVLCALFLAKMGYNVEIFQVGDKSRTSVETAHALETAQEFINAHASNAIENIPFEDFDGFDDCDEGFDGCFELDCEKTETDFGSKKADSRSSKEGSGSLCFAEYPDFSQYTLIVDAVFGIGLSCPVEGDAALLFRSINACGVDVLAVDIPSGICADTGKKLGVAVNADATVAIQAYKIGHTVGDGVDACGKVFAVDIGIGDDLFPDAPKSLSAEDIKLIPKRKRSANKGTYGRVLAVAGSRGMCGAAYLCALAAYRSGAGIVEIFTPEENRQALQTMLPEAIVTAYDSDDLNQTELLLQKSLERATAVVIGPGLGKSHTAEFLVESVFETANAPLIVDADALNIISETGIRYPTDTPVIVTPHPGEMSRLSGRQTKEICSYPVSYAKAYAEENEVICVLKYARTVVTDGENVFINTSGGPSLAKGGSGDVLTGVIAGMLCQDLSPIDAAALGVYVHGAAGEITAEAMGEYSPLAREVANAVSEVLKKR